MKRETATVAKTHFGKLLDDARKEPVVITKSNRPVAIMMAYEDYEALQQEISQLKKKQDPNRRRSVAKRYRSILKYRLKRKEEREAKEGAKKKK